MVLYQKNRFWYFTLFMELPKTQILTKFKIWRFNGVLLVHKIQQSKLFVVQTLLEIAELQNYWGSQYLKKISGAQSINPKWSFFFRFDSLHLSDDIDFSIVLSFVWSWFSTAVFSNLLSNLATLCDHMKNSSHLDKWSFQNKKWSVLNHVQANLLYFNDLKSQKKIWDAGLCFIWQ